MDMVATLRYGRDLNHEPGSDPDTHLQGRAGRGSELRHCLDQCEPGANRALRIMLVRLGIAEMRSAIATLAGGTRRASARAWSRRNRA
jgi:hypothetical protein